MQHRYSFTPHEYDAFECVINEGWALVQFKRQMSGFMPKHQGAPKVEYKHVKEAVGFVQQFHNLRKSGVSNLALSFTQPRYVAAVYVAQLGLSKVLTFYRNGIGETDWNNSPSPVLMKEITERFQKAFNTEACFDGFPVYETFPALPKKPTRLQRYWGGRGY